MKRLMPSFLVGILIGMVIVCLVNNQTTPLQVMDILIWCADLLLAILVARQFSPSKE